MTNDPIKPTGKLCSSSPETAVQPGLQSLPPVAQNPLSLESVRPLLGPSWTIECEDPKVFEKLLDQVGAAVQPIDIVDWLLVMDIVALTWEIQRSRRQCNSLVRMARYQALKEILNSIFPPDEIFDELDEESEICRVAIDCSNANKRAPNHNESLASQIARGWYIGNRRATKRAESVLSRADLSIDDVTARALSVKSNELDRIDQQNQRRVQRRDVILRQIERRREGWAKQVRRVTEDVVDAEFQETAHRPLSHRANGKASEAPE